MKIDGHRIEFRDLNEMVVCDLKLFGEIYECAEFYDAEENSICDGWDSYITWHGVLDLKTGKEVIFIADDSGIVSDDDTVYLYDNVRETILKSMRGFIDYRNAIQQAA